MAFEERENSIPLHKCTIMPAVPTPFFVDYTVNFEALKTLLMKLFNEGIRAFVICGTTAETATLTAQEYSSILNFCKNDVSFPEPCHMMAGVGTNNTAATIANAKIAVDLGYDSILLVTPYYNKPNDRMVFAHLEAVALAVPNTPVCLYNVPGRTNVFLKINTIQKLLSCCPNVCGLKEATDNVEMYKELRDALPAKFALFCGEDSMWASSVMDYGFNGVITVLGNVAAAQCVAVMEAVNNEDFKTASAINEKMKNLTDLLFAETNPVPVKYVLSETVNGWTDTVRLPLLSLEQSLRNRVMDAYNSVIET